MSESTPMSHDFGAVLNEILDGRLACRPSGTLSAPGCWSTTMQETSTASFPSPDLDPGFVPIELHRRSAAGLPRFLGREGQAKLRVDRVGDGILTPVRGMTLTVEAEPDRIHPGVFHAKLVARKRI